MLKVNGFYGHVMRNNFRSLWIFLGFAVASQLIVSVLISPIILFTDRYNIVFYSPLSFYAKYGLWIALFVVVFFIGNLLLYKKNLKRSLNFTLIDHREHPRLHKIIQSLSITAGINPPEIALMTTAARNAFVYGLNENSSTLVVTEGLLQALDDEELAAVIAHEIIHIKNGDIRLMAFINIAMDAILFLEKFNIIKIKGKKTILFLVIFPPFLILFLSAGFVSGLAMTISKASRLLITSSREFIADAEAVRLTHNPAALISALQKIEGMSEIAGLDPIADAMMIDGATIGEFATHPTIVERISVLVKHSGGMAFDARPRKDTRFGNQRNIGVGANSGAPIFGLKTNVEQPISLALNNSNAKMSVLDRVNVGNDRNVFGLTSSVKKGLMIGFFCMFGMSLLSMWSAQQAFKDMSVDGKIPHISSDLSLGGASKKGITQSTPKKKIASIEPSLKAKSTNNAKTQDALLPSYYVYLGAIRFDLVLVALIAMAFFAYVLIVKMFQRNRAREVEKYKLGNF